MLTPWLARVDSTAAAMAASRNGHKGEPGANQVQAKPTMATSTNRGARTPAHDQETH